MARWIRPEKRARIVETDGCCCAYCGRIVVVGETEDGGRPSDDAAHLDHITPRAYYRARGLKVNNAATNLVTSCSHCNESRGDESIGRWCRRVASRRLGPSATQTAVEALGVEIERTVRRQARSHSIIENSRKAA